MAVTYSVLDRLFRRTFEHPVLAPFVEWVPLEWIFSLRNPQATLHTDLGDWGSNPTLVSLDELYSDLLYRGMRDPLIVGVGRVDRKVRLETGNHRVQVLRHKGISIVPAVAYVGDSACTHRGNGDHPGAPLPLKLPEVPAAQQIMGPYPVKEYMRLSQVLRSVPWSLELQSAPTFGLNR